MVGKLVKDPVMMSEVEAKRLQVIKDAIKKNTPLVIVKRESVKKRRQKRCSSSSARMPHSRRNEQFNQRSGKDALNWYKRISR